MMSFTNYKRSLTGPCVIYASSTITKHGKKTDNVHSVEETTCLKAPRLYASIIALFQC